jgi:acyl carrier protein
MTTYDELKQLLHDKFDIDPATLSPDAPMTDYGLDSLSLAELLFTVEEHFSIDLPDSRTDINSLSGLATLIDETRANAKA